MISFGRLNLESIKSFYVLKVGSFLKKKEKKMDAIVQMFLDILGALLQLLSMLVTFVTGFVSVPGAIGLLVAMLVFYVAWRETKNALGAVILLVVSFLTVYIISAFVVWPFLFGGSSASLKSCYESAGSDQASLAICQGIGQKPASQLQSAPPVVSQPQGLAPTQAPQVVRQFRKDGLSILSKAWNLFPGDWPSQLAGQLVGPAQIPVGVKASLVCTNCQLLTSKTDERWSLTLTDTSSGSGMVPVTLTVNGYFARESKGFNANPSGSESVGTGSWEQICSTCYTDLIVPTATPTPPPAVIITPPPAAGAVSWTPQLFAPQKIVGIGTVCGKAVASNGQQLGWIPCSNGQPDLSSGKYIPLQ
ncbi:hypothetical protein A2574_00800 [Candidatus Shapirobacteria bacterium RIFOXYD1_FULL_38_32]|uniref:Uncharacterized protein n=1 Tax=Candidatus Shapirobacteria bacterium GW2011_GWE2_38_30 TaxID=1618490 RepID=A0A0G0MWT2_9BACT|nr:MAG: hypothetical protein US90_C0017G0010 [Candidatus Shapirobacteria bacterium GW2011_GWE2_38_30]OGL56381.1 MAG: hypothetical protein A2195_03280 [Candidatus Shapirobacteria bacterium RIFOXYA1_FULL_39_17]OGL56610.1 MAG: hypothetical protein A2410_01065 [Candidatus Shapirobacteria bacterium RIFOXYC1_FULL_38_24]OGL58000.1 MAG: hypothetical protein A2574_00800 [Candidatus Shapirobacteria bacterium RIFOXYD1_FULL_38_32]HAP37908.1 hypothetical protein [Candidatus Shapirobacteria bacterium]